MTVTLNLTPEVGAGLLAHAHSVGLTPEEYLRQLVARDLALESAKPDGVEESGMVWENGLLVYGAGSSLPPGYLDRAIERSRDERSRHISGSNS